MPFPQFEARYTNPFNPPEQVSFRTWLQHDPHFFRLARPDTRNVQRAIRILDTRTPFAESSPEWLTHDNRLALTLRYVSEHYNSSELVFDLFGVNRRTLNTFSFIAKEPRVAKYYEDLRGAMVAISRRRKIRQEEHARKEHANGRHAQREPQTVDTLAELVTMDVHQT